MVVVTESFLPSVNGVAGSVVHVLRQLRERGHTALVLAPGGSPADCEGAQVVALPSVPFPGYPEVRVPVASSRSLAREIGRFSPDVVHLASPFVLGGAAVRAAARVGVPVVAVYQTDVAGFASRYGLGAAGHEAAWRRIRAIHGRAHVTLAPSVAAAEDLQRNRVPRVLVWPRGVDPDGFWPGARDPRFRREVAGDDDAVLVGFVGRLAREKRVGDLRVLADLPKVRVLVVGDGPERDRLARALPAARFLGMLTGPALSRAVASLDIAVHPGPHETFCQSAQEAMASAVPVVAVAAGGVRELVDPSRTGWVYPPGDLSRFREMVQDLAGDPAKRRAMGAAARAAVQNRTWPVVCEQLLGHYAEAAQRPGLVVGRR